MKEYRKRPVVVEVSPPVARDNVALIGEWCHGIHSALDDPSAFVVPTLEGPHQVSWGDRIIRGVSGEFYPIKPDIFEETYEEVTE
jgi:hypothetical protein